MRVLKRIVTLLVFCTFSFALFHLDNHTTKVLSIIMYRYLLIDKYTFTYIKRYTRNLRIYLYESIDFANYLWVGTQLVLTFMHTYRSLKFKSLSSCDG